MHRAPENKHKSIKKMAIKPK